MQYFLSICLVLSGSVVIGSKLLIPRETSRANLDCSKFQRDIDILRSFSFPVQINPFTIVDKTYAIMNALNQVDQLYIIREKSLPLEVFCLVYLHTLVVDSTRFEPSVELDDDSVVTDLPPQINRLTRLRILTLTNASIARMPGDSIASLTNLVNIVVKNCGLLELPSTISSLRDLQTLDLSNNRLTSLPDAIGSLPKLQTINVPNNSISVLPSKIGNATNLTALYIQMNPIVSLQPLSGLPKLVILNAMRCQIKILPTNLPVLSTFVASYNNIDDIFHLTDLASTKLTRLDLSNNQIDMVPPQISQFAPTLQYLWLNNNDLLHLPTEIVLLTKLLQCSIAYNFIPNAELNAIYSSFRSKVPGCALTYTPQNLSF